MRLNLNEMRSFYDGFIIKLLYKNNMQLVVFNSDFARKLSLANS